jgi:hypothetical protein
LARIYHHRVAVFVHFVFQKLNFLDALLVFGPALVEDLLPPQAVEDIPDDDPTAVVARG